jgi:hypothetical protein
MFSVFPDVLRNGFAARCAAMALPRRRECNFDVGYAWFGLALLLRRASCELHQQNEGKYHKRQFVDCSSPFYETASSQPSRAANEFWTVIRKFISRRAGSD